jgi:hypothetical protein
MKQLVMTGSCVVCGIFFGYNPHKVPNMQLTPTKPREPVCQDCVPIANRLLAKKGLPPFVIEDDTYYPIPTSNP